MAIPHQIRRLVHKVRQSDLVSDVEVHFAHIRVHYFNGIKEKWWFRDHNITGGKWSFMLPSDMDFGEDDPPLYIGHQYSVNPLEKSVLDSFFIVPKTLYLKANFVPLRFMVHRIIDRFKEYIKVIFTNDELIEDFMRLRSDRLSRFKYGRHYRLYGNITENPGHKLIEHFIGLDIKSLDTFSIYSAIDSCMRSWRDITRANINRFLYQNVAHPPTFYRLLFDKLDVRDTVMLDTNPEYGSKALGAYLSGCQYYYVDGHFAGGADDLGDFLDIRFYGANDRDVFDVVLVNEDDLDKYYGKGDSFIFWTSEPDKYDCLSKLEVNINPLYGQPTVYFVLI